MVTFVDQVTLHLRAGGDGDDSMLVVSSLEGVEEDTVAIVSFVLSVWCAPLNGWTRG